MKRRSLGIIIGMVTALMLGGGGGQAAEKKMSGKKQAPRPRAVKKTTEKKPVVRGWEMPYPPQEPPQADDIFHVPTGTKVSLEGAMDVIAGARVIYVGETHDNIHAHRVQLRVIQELQRRFPGRFAIGMEMFREPQQEVLDRWTRGELTEIEFLKAAKWYETWGDDYGYYRDILAFARENRIDVLALNPDKKLQDEVSKTGLENLPADLKAKLPEIGAIDPYQRESLQAIYGAHLKMAGMVDSFLRIQSLWEETMATRIVNYLKDPWGEDKRVVVLSGGWHVRYGFGIPRKVFHRLPAPYVIVSPEELSVPEEKQDQLMQVDLPEIPLFVADFFWMVPYEDLEKDKMRMGTILETKEGRLIIKSVLEGSPAQKAGLREGSELVAIDGQPLEDMTDVFYQLRNKREGDAAAITLRKDGAEETVAIVFFKIPKKKAEEHGKRAAGKPGKK